MRAPFVDPFSSLTLLNPALPLLGRDREMQLLQSVLENTTNAQPRGPRAAIISGELGIGKSRLLEELCTTAAQHTMMILRASAYESGEMFPYLPFIEALRPIVRSSSEEDLRRYTGLERLRSENLLDPSLVNVSLTGLPLITALCGLFPELADRLQITPVQEVLSSDQAKFRLFDSVATLLERVAQEQPVLFCIDNLQWADGATLELTMYLTVRLHNSQVALIGTTRPPQPVASQQNSTFPITSTQAVNALRLLHELMQQGLLLLLPLGPLSEYAVEQHIHALLPGVLPEELVQQLLRQVGGNPFFLEELVRTLCMSQQLVLNAGSWQITIPIQHAIWPERITQAVRQRLQGLACRDLLQIAALLGREFPRRARTCINRRSTSGNPYREKAICCHKLA
jgi:predicted ATPase